MFTGCPPDTAYQLSTIDDSKKNQINALMKFEV